DPACFRKVSVGHQLAQEFSVQVNNRMTSLLQSHLECHRKSGLPRSRLTGKPVDHAGYFKDESGRMQEDSAFTLVPPGNPRSKRHRFPPPQLPCLRLGSRHEQESPCPGCTPSSGAWPCSGKGPAHDTRTWVRPAGVATGAGALAAQSV